MRGALHFIALNLITTIDCGVIEGNSKGETCTGALVLENTDGERLTFPSSETPIDTYIDTEQTGVISWARVDGCGCYWIYYGKKGRRGGLVIRAGEVMDRQQIGRDKVRSLERVICSKAAMPVWGVLLVVFVLVVLVAVVTVVVVRRLRQYKEVRQDPPSVS